MDGECEQRGSFNENGNKKLSRFKKCFLKLLRQLIKKDGLEDLRLTGYSDVKVNISKRRATYILSVYAKRWLNVD